jgi:hypothetical protein
MPDASRNFAMLYLIFGHTAKEPPLRMGPMFSFKVKGAQIVDHTGAVVARHNGHRWTAQGRPFYRVDCAGPVVVKLEGAQLSAPMRGPFEHFSLFNGTAYASRDLFAHYDEQDCAWHLHKSNERCPTLLVTPG